MMEVGCEREVRPRGEGREAERRQTVGGDETGEETKGERREGETMVVGCEGSGRGVGGK